MADLDLHHAAAWRNIAGRTRMKINAAWWVQSFAPLLAVFGAAAFGAVLYLRTTWQPMIPWVTAASLGGAVLICAAAAWWWARRKFFTVDECLVRIESRMRLHNALSAAAAGVSPWPTPPPRDQICDGFHWRWQWLALPVCIAAASLLLAFLIPVRPPETVEDHYPPPSSLQQAEKMVNELKKEDLARKEDLERFEKAIEALKHTPAEDWYSHSNLEAADNLKEAISEAAAELGNHYDQAAGSLEALDESDGPLGESVRQQAAQEFANAVQGLKNGPLQPNKELMKALEQLDPKTLCKQMSREQLEQLRQKLKKNGQCAGQTSGHGRPMGDTEKALREALEKAENGNLGAGPGQQEMAYEGDGTPERGPGVAPLGMKKEPSELGTNHPEKESSRDLNRLTPGDLLGTTSGEHPVDKTKTGPVDAGTVGSEAKGGEAVWKESLMPEEKRVLKRFFK